MSSCCVTILLTARNESALGFYLRKKENRTEQTRESNDAKKDRRDTTSKLGKQMREDFFLIGWFSLDESFVPRAEKSKRKKPSNAYEFLE